MNRHKLIIILILILAGLLRFSLLDSIPKGLHYKEATIGWRAQNLINFGKDEFGRSFPFYFSNWTEMEMPLATYLTVPFVAISQTNIFFLRLPFAIAGVLLVLGSILLTQKLFPDKKNLPSWAGFVMAIAPSAVFFSRIVNPEIIALTLIVWGLYIYNLKKGQTTGLLLITLSCFALIQSLIIVIGISSFLLFRNRNLKTLIGPMAIVILLFALLLTSKAMVPSLIDNNFTLFKETSIVADINIIRGYNLEYGLPNILNELFFNKAFFAVSVIKNFISYFSPAVIFAKGDNNSLNSFSNYGIMLLTMLPMFIIGFYKFIKEKYNNTILILSWLVLAAIPGIFLLVAPDIRKFSFALFPLVLLTAIGFVNVSKHLKIIFTGLMIFNLMVVSYDVINKETIRQQSAFHNNSLMLVSKLSSENNGQIWLTDSIDPNIGPKIAYLNKIPYTDSNLKDSSENIYRAWVNKISNITIGDKKVIKDAPGEFNLLIKSKDEEYSLCYEQYDSLGEGDKQYQFLSKCKLPNE